MIDFYNDTNVKEWSLIFDNGIIFDGSRIRGGSLKITESINSEEDFQFGNCEPSEVAVTVDNDDNSYLGLWFRIELTVGLETIILGRYKVGSEKVSSDKTSRELVAYDIMHDILETNLAGWYNSLFQQNAVYTIKQFRDALFAYLKIPQISAILVNDNQRIGKTIDAEVLNGKSILTAICQLNGCYGHIFSDGSFQYLTIQGIKEGIVPRVGLYPSAGLHPMATQSAENIPQGMHITAEFEDFHTTQIEKIQIRQDADDIGGIAGTGENTYVIEDNFLCYGMETETLQQIAQNILDIVKDIWYVPANITAVGNPNLHVGDAIKVVTKQGTIYTYLFNRVLHGGQVLRDEYTANGKKEMLEKVSSVNDSIVRLVGKTNRLKRTVEELNSLITDEKDGLQSQITQNANAIKAVVTQSYAGNLIKKEMFGDKLVEYADTDSGFGAALDGNSIILGGITLNGGTDYNISFIAMSEDAMFTFVEINCRALDHNGSVLADIMLFPTRVSTYPTTYDGTFRLTSGASVYIEISCDYRLNLWDVVLSQGSVAQPWTPNRTEEYAMLQLNAQALEAKVERTGGDASSFSWELLSTGFKLKSNNKEVFKCDDNGIEIDGYTKTTELEAQVARIDTIESNYVKTNQLDATNANVSNLSAKVANLNSAVVGKLSVDEANIKYATIENLAISNNKIDTLSATKLDASRFTADNISAMIANLSGLNAKSINCSMYLVNAEGRGWGLAPVRVNIGGQSYIVIGTRA